MSNRYNMFKSPALGKTRRVSKTPNKVPNLVYNNPEPYNERKEYNPMRRPYLPMPLKHYMNAEPPKNVVEPDTIHSWNYFPAQRSSFYSHNPLALMKLRNNAVKGKLHPYYTSHRYYNRHDLSRAIFNARHQVFPVAARKTRHRKNRKSRKSRR